MSATILIIEDDQEISQILEIYLKNQGYTVFKAFDGLYAWQITQKEKVDLAIVDVMMPKMDGITYVMKVRERFDFPIIMLYAKTEDIDKIKG